VADLPRLCGLVLAGGASRRMGEDKALKPVAGVPMLRRVADAMMPLVTELYVSARGTRDTDAVRSAYPVIVDEPQLAGPGGGILSAHQRQPDVAWLVVACDMPLITTAVLRQLVAARAPEYAAIAWRGIAEGVAEPLCAVYEPATLAAFRQHVAAGGNSSPRDWLASTHVRLLERPGDESLEGANTLAEYERLERVASSGRQHGKN